jgi:PAS domain S-box-containing protein
MFRPQHRPRPSTPDVAASAKGGPLLSGVLLVVFAPVAALVLFTVLLALAASWIGWHPTEMLIAAGLAGCAIIVLATILLYGLASSRRSASAALRQADARVADILRSAMDPIISVDQDQRVVLFNAAAEQVFGQPREAVIGQPLDLLIPQRFHASHRSHVERFGAAGVTSRRMGADMVLTALRSSGEEFPIEASISQHSEGERKFFTVILRDVSVRVKAEQALRQSQEELKELATAAHQAREQEQSRIARELHDELGQSLTALKMLVASTRESVAAGDDHAPAKLEKMEALLDRTVAATRRIAADLRPLMLDDLGLIPAVEWLAEDFTQRHGIACELRLEDPDLSLEDAHETAVFRIVQESLTNVARHARAKRVEVSFSREDSRLTISVSDDGVGFATDAPRSPKSRGLLGMRERAYLLGGEVSVESSPGRGTRVEVSLPLERASQL